MNQKGFVNIIVIIGIVMLVSIAGYFVVSRQLLLPTSIFSPTPSSTPTSIPNPTPSPNPNPTPSPIPKSQSGVTVISPNGGAYILGSQVKIGWHVASGYPSNALPMNAYVLISLLGPNDNSKTFGRVALSATEVPEGEYIWTSDSVIVNGKRVQILGDRKYWIKVTVYSGNPDFSNSLKIFEDTSDTSFELAYGGPPLSTTTGCSKPDGHYEVLTATFIKIGTTPGGGRFVVIRQAGAAGDESVDVNEDVYQKLQAVTVGTTVRLYTYFSSAVSGAMTGYTCVEI